MWFLAFFRYNYFIGIVCPKRQHNLYLATEAKRKIIPLRIGLNFFCFRSLNTTYNGFAIDLSDFTFAFHSERQPDSTRGKTLPVLGLHQTSIESDCVVQRDL